MIPAIALVLAFSLTPTTIESASTVAKHIPSPTMVAVADNINALNKSSEKLTPQSLAGEYTLVITNATQEEMKKAGIKEFTGKIVLKADSTFEGQLMISGASPDGTGIRRSEIKVKGMFEVKGNVALLTVKSSMTDGKEDKVTSSVDKYTISTDGKELKPEGQAGISFIRKDLK
ncbi:hypothetical protein V2H45_02820 [Tumidithrix elongata RA019]|uniref:Uncharacterized protein n=1 Tax=Tumidithrix elongata BACA0141 TaxID=2716417 RepID=A0AAW9PP55_9CYAN|nr:hypothetical protein [Tumidithrix elongata RA019]